MTPCFQISQQLMNEGYTGVSTSTVWRRGKEIGFDFKPPKIRQFLNDAQKEYCVLFFLSFYTA